MRCDPPSLFSLMCYFQVCLGSCVLFASLRRQSAANAASAADDASPRDKKSSSSSISSTTAGFITPAAKRSKTSKPEPVSKKKGKGAVVAAGVGSSHSGGGSGKGGGGDEVKVPHSSFEAEGLVKEGKVDVSGLRGAVLQVAEAVPEKAWRTGQWRRVSYPAWTAFVLVATGPRELMQVGCLEEGGGEILHFMYNVVAPRV